MDALQIYETIRREMSREDKRVEFIEFNIRNDMYIMNLIYDYVTSNTYEHHFIPHEADPLILNEETYEQLIDILNDKGIRYVTRNDDFI
ncbi:hypothetical protein [Nosocomiicoccus sp. HMSC09A07]|uniref:hypothetical protein n=1 Tax=Nosocomiicoccus sp. HMSC09A07 TaxID=1581145 RepID=UPI0008A5F048|nr:hypothetical protein [Nosocomiicoccus sp. HMSC09A07]OFS62490.1 hypothetical protein HMPREF3177_05455 [Nosocomiicoccus sp. HMSC09A07]